MSNPKLVYWDSCIFLDALQQTPAWSVILKQFVDAGKDGKLSIVTSSFTLVEVIRIARHDVNMDPGVAEHQIASFFDNAFISVRQLDKPLAGKARVIARDHGIKPADAVHIATAIDMKVSVMHTRDGLTKSRGLIGKSNQIGNPALLIEEPKWAQQIPFISQPSPSPKATSSDDDETD